MRSELRIFVQHVPKTAGTALFGFLEPNYRYETTMTTQRFWEYWSRLPDEYQQRRQSAQPLVACTPPSAISKLSYIHGHFRDLFRRVLCADWLTVGTCRSVDQRLISMLNHQLRDPKMDSRVVSYLQGGKQPKGDVLEALMLSSHMAFFTSHSPYKGLLQHSWELEADIERLATEALINIEDYDCVIDASALESHCRRFAAYLPHAGNLGRRNAREEFGQRSHFARKDIAALRRDFPAFFYWEDRVYGKLKDRSDALLDVPFVDIVDTQKDRATRTITVLPDTADISGMSPAIPAGLAGWQGAYYRNLEQGARIVNVQVRRGHYLGCIWFWCADPSRAASTEVSIEGAECLQTRRWFVEDPSQHLWVVELRFTTPIDQHIDIAFSGPPSSIPSLWLGTKLYWSDYASAVTAALRHGDPAGSYQ